MAVSIPFLLLSLQTTVPPAKPGCTNASVLSSLLRKDHREGGNPCSVDPSPSEVVELGNRICNITKDKAVR